MPSGYKKDGSYAGNIFKKGNHPKTEFNKGYKHSDETIKKIIKSRKWYKHSDISKERMKNARLEMKEKNGFINSSETREKIRIGLLKNKNAMGHKMSESGGKSISNFNRKFRSEKNCHFWKGGITPKIVKIRNSMEIRLWRQSIFCKENFTCQKCNDNTGGNLNAHHIHNFSDFPELRFAIDNGITLCKTCHKNFHSIYGKKNNTKEQLLHFLKN